MLAISKVAKILVKVTGKAERMSILFLNISKYFSGGPFMIYDADSDTWNIAGITSYGYGCAQAEKPGVYTRVSTFINWIDDHMRDEYLESQASIQSVSFFILLLLFCINWIP